MANVETSLVLLASGLSDFEAKVLTARLGAEGIVWQVRGIVDSVYPLGDIAVLVREDELAEAMSVLSPAGDASWGHDEGWAADGRDPGPAADRYRRRWWFTAMMIGALTTLFVMRLLAFG